MKHNKWEKEFFKLSKFLELGPGEETYLWEGVKSLLHQERKRARKNEYNISMMIETSLGYIEMVKLVAMMIETSLGYIEMGKKEKAIYHLEIAQEMLRPLSILKGNKK